MHWTQPPATCGEFVKTVAFNIESIGQRPIQLSAVEDVGVSDEAVCNRGDRSCNWQCISCITPNRRSNSSGYNQDNYVRTLIHN